MKSRQVEMADREKRFGTNLIMEARGKSLGEAVRDALLRRFETYDGVAAALSAAFGHVTGQIVKVAFAGAERNYWRGEWILLVADDPEVRAAVAPPPTDPVEAYRALREQLARRAPGELEIFDRKLGRL